MSKSHQIPTGPWEARYSSVIDVERNEIIAVMVCGSVYRKNELEDYDTARLIAAAPELYEALEQCRFALEPYDDIKPRDWETDRVRLRRAHEVARAALAKARGVA